MYAWIHQHTLGHHSYTNIDGADPDIVTAAQVSGMHSEGAGLQASFTHVYDYRRCLTFVGSSGTRCGCLDTSTNMSMCPSSTVW